MLAHEFTIRRGLPVDKPTVIAVINSVAAEGIYLLTEHYTPTPAWTRALENADESSLYLLLVAEVDRQIVGWCRVFPFDLGEKARHVADLGMGVIREWRGRGVGSSLLRRALRESLNGNYLKITLSVFSSNSRAIRFFQRHGFTETGVRHRQYLVGNKFVDEILMEQWLQKAMENNEGNSGFVPPLH